MTETTSPGSAPDTGQISERGGLPHAARVRRGRRERLEQPLGDAVPLGVVELA